MNILKTKTINIKKEVLSNTKRVIEKLYITNKSIFKNVSLEKMSGYVLAEKSKTNKIETVPAYFMNKVVKKVVL